jgi:hypothetical protein
MNELNRDVETRFWTYYDLDAAYAFSGEQAEHERVRQWLEVNDRCENPQRGLGGRSFCQCTTNYSQRTYFSMIITFSIAFPRESTG